MLSNIPEELKALQQWVCFDIDANGNKVPFTPGQSNSKASANKPRTWRSFRAACKDVEEGKRHYVGFCFSSADPYTFIDLDDPEDQDQVRVFERIQTYAQRSVSGEGCHLIANGTFRGAGKHPARPEAGIFKENRFCLMTGDIADDRSTIEVVPDEDLQAIHTWLGGSPDEIESVQLEEFEAELPDMTVYEMGCDRFLKFEALCNGEWEQFEEYGGDHSAADHAFIAMLCDLTESNDQVRHIFRISKMWTPERAKKKAGHGLVRYVDRTVRKIRNSQEKERRISERIVLNFKSEDSSKIITLNEVDDCAVRKFGARDQIDALPEGLLRDIANYSYSAAYLPLQEAAITSSITILSGLAGRGYVTSSRMGLNMWMVLVGRTGCGKDELQQNCKRILNALSKTSPKIRRLLGGELVSGPAIETVFQDTLRFISYFKEFGKTFSMLSGSNQSEYVKTLVGALLNSYNAAGANGSLEGRRRAQDQGEKRHIIRPCLSIMGDSTPQELYDSVSLRELASGLLQRFILVNVEQNSWSVQENPDNGKPPESKLLNKLATLAEEMERFDALEKSNPQIVGASPKAQQMLSEYAMEKRLKAANAATADVSDELHNRSGLKALKLSSLAGIAQDFTAPRVELEHAEWAIRTVDYHDAQMMSKFSSGEIGSAQVKQESVIKKEIDRIRKLSPSLRRKIGMEKKVAATEYLVPFSVLKEGVINHPCFFDDRIGAVTAFERAVEAMVRAGDLTRIKEDKAIERYDHIRGVLLCVL